MAVYASRLVPQKDNCVDLSAYKAYYTDKIRALAQTYLREEQTLSTTERCCISLSTNELSLIAVHKQADTFDISFLETLHYDDVPSLKLVLSGMTTKHKLNLVPVYWLLNPYDYDLNLIDSMPVPKNELKTALSWRIRSLIKYPVEEAILDYFELPAKKNSPGAPLIAAVTAQSKLLSDRVNMIKECGLKLTNIDIPELAMLNLAALHEDDEKSSAFLYFYDHAMILNITYQKTLYFTRRISLPLNIDKSIDYEKLSLEILRYFDFFRSQWRLASPTRVFAADISGDVTLVAKALTERLLNTVTPYKLTNINISSDDNAKINAHYLLDYGCLLRKDISNAKPAN